MHQGKVDVVIIWFAITVMGVETGKLLLYSALMRILSSADFV